jgi:hypothetical protein
MPIAQYLAPEMRGGVQKTLSPIYFTRTAHAFVFSSYLLETSSQEPIIFFVLDCLIKIRAINKQP